MSSASDLGNVEVGDARTNTAKSDYAGTALYVNAKDNVNGVLTIVAGEGGSAILNLYKDDANDTNPDKAYLLFSNGTGNLTGVVNATTGWTIEQTGAMTANVSLASPTVNTGQGDNELYDMNQNVQTTDSPTFSDLTVTSDLWTVDEAYGAGWNGSAQVPTKNAVYDKIETLGGGMTNAVDTTDGVQISGDTTISGSVGIGVTAPTQALEVEGNVIISGNLSGDTAYFREINNPAGSGTTTVANLAVNTNMTVSGSANNIGVKTLSISGNTTLSGSQAYSTVVYCDGTATITLPPVATGMNLTILTVGTKGIQIDPNASDKIWLDGVALDDGDKINNLSVSGNMAVLTYFSADGWYAATTAFTDGG